jgi:uncharacterized protein
MYIPMAIETAVISIAKTFPVLFVTGPRQVGKTTLLKHIAEKGRNYVTLDDPLQRRLALEEPELFLERFEAPVIIDEIQYAPKLLSYIKKRVDRDGTKGAYWLTGSQMFHLMRDASESLAGRVWYCPFARIVTSRNSRTRKRSFPAIKGAAFRQAQAIRAG